MHSRDLRQKYLDFFSQRGHKQIPSSSLVPKNDPTTLFTSSGMQPLIPYLLGEKHPLGNRLVDSQRCFRSQDIEEVGDSRHTTFFEMLGNWSLGDYFKKEQLCWYFEFLTDVLKLNPQKLYVTVFAGDERYGIPKDEESIQIWKDLFAQKGIEAKVVDLFTQEKGGELGMQGGRIFAYGIDKNWWSRFKLPDDMPPGEPGGPDSEVFYEFTQVKHDPKFGKYCHPNCDCGRFLEIGNSVFMQYQKQSDGTFRELPQKNVDFGGGLERMLAAALNTPDVFTTDLYQNILETIQNSTNKSYQDPSNKAYMQVIADHMKASAFLIIDGVRPSNKLQGYVLRRLLRRSAVKMHQLMGSIASSKPFEDIAEQVLTIYDGIQGVDKKTQQETVSTVVAEEINRFGKSLEKGLKEIQKIDQVDGKIAFDLYQTYGFPLELTEELFLEKGQKIDHRQFETEFERHKELSRTASAGIFKGGLADHSEQTTKLHTANHLLQAALRQILGTHVIQKGSNITPERLRFDFSHSEKVTEQQLKQVEDLVNEKIKEDLPVRKEIMSKEKALQSGALAFFGEKYGDQVSVYSIGSGQEVFSREFCAGPHVTSTGVLGRFKILKEESAGSGIRRIYATVEN